MEAAWGLGMLLGGVGKGTGEWARSEGRLLGEARAGLRWSHGAGKIRGRGPGWEQASARPALCCPWRVNLGAVEEVNGVGRLPPLPA